MHPSEASSSASMPSTTACLHDVMPHHRPNRQAEGSCRSTLGGVPLVGSTARVCLSSGPVRGRAARPVAGHAPHRDAVGRLVAQPRVEAGHRRGHLPAGDPGVLAQAPAVRERQARHQRPLRVVGPDHRRPHVAAERQRPLAPGEVRLCPAAPEREDAAVARLAVHRERRGGGRLTGCCRDSDRPHATRPGPPAAAAHHRQSGDPDRIPAAGRAQRPAHGRPLGASDRHHRAPGISRSWQQNGRITAQ